MRLVGWAFGAIIALVLIVFAVSNPMPVGLRFEPFPFVLELPLYGAILTSLILGFAMGGFLAWLGGWKWRRRARKAEAEAARLRQELRTAQGPPQPPLPPAV